MDGIMSVPLRPPRVFPLEVGNVEALWPQWEPLLKLALRGDETVDPVHVRDAVLAGKAHLWVQWGTTLEAFEVTEFIDYPKGRWLRIWLAAASPDYRLDEDAFYDTLSEFRDVNDCRGFEWVGRRGWERRFPEARFIGVMLRTTI